MPLLSKARTALLYRVATILAVSLVALLVVLWGVVNILAPVLIWLVPEWEPALYDWGVEGFYRTTEYASLNLTSPLFSIPTWSDRCDDGRYILITPKGNYVPNGGPTIVDPRGNLVWMSDQYRNAMNLNMQTYKGDKFLTFWTGDKAATSGQGVYHMLDETYTLRHTVKPHGDNMHADLHEFQITHDDTGLLTIYNYTAAPPGFQGETSTGYITESAFQEVDIATGNMVFEWRASDHYSLADTFYWAPIDGWLSSRPYDWFHINSIQKDRKGNYLISSRHLHMVACLEAGTGKVLWTLGGRRNDFQDLSDGQATNFQWQHDARWVDEEQGILSLYDNGDAGPVQSRSPRSRGIVVQLDLDKKTVTLLHEYVSLRETRAASQGSVQVLPPAWPGGDVFVGWGHSASFSEFSADGNLLCEWHFSPSAFDYVDLVASYRALKVEGWVGRPVTKPQAVIRGGKLYVSWNGATEVRTWSLQATRMYDVQSGREEGEYEEIDVLVRQGGEGAVGGRFESEFILPDGWADMYVNLRVAALDKDGELLDFSATAHEVQEGRSLWESVGLLVLLVGFFVGAWIFYVKVVRKQQLAWPGLPAAGWEGWERVSGGLGLAGWGEKWTFNPWSVYRYRKLG
ncbi:uncharacterized protein HMPREF1541_10034 [Cyphellophora europaea CBS 101466]|uniref:Arylsulfotransferase N-terminal domain-containing protein n=1 Tax=Cyphellophora europaea (strain CBS 101466) TaxID=1220924 RepID=W2S900_CYPE1|nr:uncharacterized protein HMPREF1541_10034 [Cyphellophora europaea CBS 101466]ETN45157.1 hypothetical protein HMPREF1541_10034 [Cyphellophora europaea CBS 101466]